MQNNHGVTEARRLWHFQVPEAGSHKRPSATVSWGLWSLLNGARPGWRTNVIWPLRCNDATLLNCQYDSPRLYVCVYVFV